jgi:hypothetical protein
LVIRSGTNSGLDFFNIEQEAALYLVRFPQLRFVEAELVTGKLPRTVVAVLMAIGTEYNKVAFNVCTAFGLLNDMVDLEALLRADRASMARID